MVDVEPAGPEELISESERRFQKVLARAGLAVGPIAALAVWFAPLPLSAEAHRLAAVIALVGTYWICEPIPLPVTAVLGVALCAVFGIDAAKTLFAPFGHPLIFLFMGSFILARAMSVHGLDRRFASAILSWRAIGHSPFRVMAAFGAITAAISMWISNTAATAMMFPIGMGLAARLRAGRSFGCGMMLMAAYAASIGGLATPVGTPPNLIGIGLLAEQAGVRITFFQWMLIGMPFTAAMFSVLCVLLYALHRPESVGEPIEADESADGRDRPWSAGEKNTLAAFGAAVLLWIIPGVIGAGWGGDSAGVRWFEAHLSESTAAVLAAALLFVLPLDRSFERMTLTWKDAVRIDWGTLLLFGGGLSLGDQMFKTGLAQAFGTGLTNLLGVHSLWAITGLSIAMGILLSELTSNTASAAMVIPVAMSAAQAAGVPVLPPALGACLGASFGFCLPVSTPPNAIIYGSGLVPIPRMIRAGVGFDLLGFFILWAGLRILCPALGWA